MYVSAYVCTPDPQLKRKDKVVIYATHTGEWGSLMDYSTRNHMKHNTICVRQQVPTPEYVVPVGYSGLGVPVASGILQRTFREYKHLSKRIVLTGNGTYAPDDLRMSLESKGLGGEGVIVDHPANVYFQTDARYSLHRSDNLFGILEPRDDDVVVELGITTLSRALKVTQFNRTVHIACHPGLPVRLASQLGSHGSTVSVYLQNEATKSM